jgi:hypothetical protein
MPAYTIKPFSELGIPPPNPKNTPTTHHTGTFSATTTKLTKAF